MKYNLDLFNCIKQGKTLHELTRTKRGANNESRYFKNQKSLLDSLRYSKVVDGEGNGILFLAFEIEPQQSGDHELKAIQLNALQTQLTSMIKLLCIIFFNQLFKEKTK